MTTVKETVSLSASPTAIWSVIGDFGRLDFWHPAVAASETDEDGSSRIRHLTLVDGNKIVERLDTQDDKKRRYTYTILKAGPLPVRNYQSTIEVAGDEDATTVTWSSNFEPHGVSEADARAAISGVYTGGFAALVEKFGSA